jgi:small subunit ribosomal protein S8
MSMDCIGDFLTIIRNGILASKPLVAAPHSKMRLAIATILKEEGFIKDFLVEELDNNKKNIKITLKYYVGESVIHNVKRISTPGCRVYRPIESVKPVIGGLGLSILSTSQGVMSHKKAKQLKVGGEIICTVW